MFQLLAITRAGCRRSFSRHLLHKLTTQASMMLILVLLQLSFAQQVSAKTSKKPNIIFIMVDDLGYGDISPYGGWIKTPNIERLAAGGLKFTDFHSSGVVCSPTRAGLMTGRYQQRAGIPGVVFADPKRKQHQHGLGTNEITFAEILQKAGYATAIYGKWHLGYFTKYNPRRHGFGHFRGYVSGNIDFFSHIDQAGTYDWWNNEQKIQEPGYVTHLINKHALAFIEKNKAKPFCLYLPHEAPHYPYQGPADQPKRVVGKGNKADAKLSGAEVKKRYRQMVEEMDLSVGNILDSLKKHNLTDNTLILFFSDNGANRRGSNQPLRGYKGSVWEGGHRVPCIAYWPGKIKAGSVTKQLAISIDLMPTILKLSQTAVPNGHQLDGIDLSSVLLEKKTIDHRKLFWNGVAMRDGPWKLITHTKGLKKTALFNLDEDLSEKNNLAAKHPQRVNQMTKALAAWRLEVANGATQQPSEK